MHSLRISRRCATALPLPPPPMSASAVSSGIAAIPAPRGSSNSSRSLHCGAAGGSASSSRSLLLARHAPSSAGSKAAPRYTPPAPTVAYTPQPFVPSPDKQLPTGPDRMPFRELLILAAVGFGSMFLGDILMHAYLKPDMRIPRMERELNAQGQFVRWKKAANPYPDDDQRPQQRQQQQRTRIVIQSAPAASPPSPPKA